MPKKIIDNIVSIIKKPSTSPVVKYGCPSNPPRPTPTPKPSNRPCPCPKDYSCPENFLVDFEK